MGAGKSKQTGKTIEESSQPGQLNQMQQYPMPGGFYGNQPMQFQPQAGMMPLQTPMSIQQPYIPMQQPFPFQQQPIASQQPPLPFQQPFMQNLVPSGPMGSQPFFPQNFPPGNFQMTGNNFFFNIKKLLINKKRSYANASINGWICIK